jgi:hypothetical protein
LEIFLKKKDKMGLFVNCCLAWTRMLCVTDLYQSYTSVTINMHMTPGDARHRGRQPAMAMEEPMVVEPKEDPDFSWELAEPSCAS